MSINGWKAKTAKRKKGLRVRQTPRWREKDKIEDRPRVIVIVIFFCSSFIFMHFENLTFSKLTFCTHN
jgi:hypothetical protein